MGVVTNLTNKYQKCIDACVKCAQACDECTKLCLYEPDVQARKTCIATLVECARICSQSACFMSFDSQFSKDMCTLCAKVCDKCADECSMFKDDHCLKCSTECRTCADECRMMVQG